MKILVYDIHKFERALLEQTLGKNHPVEYVELKLNEHSVNLARNFQAVIVFIHDTVSAPVLESLKQNGIRFLITRSAGFNHIDLEAAKRSEIRIANVPHYSPYAVAEHTLALMLALNRKIIRAHHRLMDLNFSLNGLVGFDMHGKTVGIVGLGKIGKVVAKILSGFGCKLLTYDIKPDENFNKTYDILFTPLDEIYKQADILTLHVPLNLQTRYLINQESLVKMKKGVMLINTSRGALINTRDAITALKSGQIGYLGLDVYEEENELFFEDHSEDILQDDKIARLMSFPNVLITSHQAFLTQEALENIAKTTAENLDCFEKNKKCENELT
ncbi:MAG: 2-hydroxyacid dehydrogenase [Deltaproteobacteria bacterium]|nr:2-hydroxyacid dehydrogenase [Deltaproteobacteria bacterium]